LETRTVEEVKTRVGLLLQEEEEERFLQYRSIVGRIYNDLKNPGMLIYNVAPKSE
jgi:hypothetical protein